MQYSDFADELVAEFTTIQNKFKKKYQIDTYENWFYDQATELLTLSSEDKEINFKYIPIGTFSHKSETWMWAWENEGSIEKSKNETLKVKEFGIIENYEKLINGYFESDIYEPWEFIAIAHKILHGIGGYRVKSDLLEIFFLIIEQVDNEVAKQIKEQTIVCTAHGMNRIAFICKHLNKEAKTGFEEAFPTFKGMELVEDDDLQAWCNACELVRQKTDGWDEESMEFADIQLVCEDCYFEIKDFNLN
jgi:hypothetical protein